MALHDRMGMLLHSRYCFPAHEGRHGRELLCPGECVKTGMWPRGIAGVCYCIFTTRVQFARSVWRTQMAQGS